MKEKYLAWGGVLSGLGFLGWYVSKQIRYSQKLEYKVSGYKLISIGLNGARIDLQLTLSNKGRLEIFVKKLKLNIFSEGNFLATIYAGQGITVLPKKETETSVQILLNPKVLLQSTGNIILNIGDEGWKNIPLTIDGSATIAQGVVPFFIPIKYSFKISDLKQS